MTTNDDSVNALNLTKQTNIYFLQYNNQKMFVSTIQPLCKYISNLKQRNKSLSIDSLNIISNNYTFGLLEKFQYKTKFDITNKINYYKQLELNRTKPIESQLNNSLYNNSLQYEFYILNLLQKIFDNSNIINSKNRYAKYDFLDLNSGYFFELKNNTYSFNTYKSAVINCEKLDYPNLILIFGYKNIIFLNGKFITVDKYYYIIYDIKKFATFNKRYIINKITNRSSFVIDIPTSYLLELNETTSLSLPNKITDELNIIQKYFNFT